MEAPRAEAIAGAAARAYSSARVLDDADALVALALAFARLAAQVQFAPRSMLDLVAEMRKLADDCS